MQWNFLTLGFLLSLASCGHPLVGLKMVALAQTPTIIVTRAAGSTPTPPFNSTDNTTSSNSTDVAPTPSFNTTTSTNSNTTTDTNSTDVTLPDATTLPGNTSTQSDTTRPVNDSTISTDAKNTTSMTPPPSTTSSCEAAWATNEIVPGWGIALLVLVALALLLVIILLLLLLWCCCRRRRYSNFGPNDQQHPDMPLYTTHGRFDGPNGNYYDDSGKPAKNRTGMYTVNQ